MYEETECQDTMYLRWAEHLQRAALQKVAAADRERSIAQADPHASGVELTRVEHVMSKRDLLIRVTR